MNFRKIPLWYFMLTKRLFHKISFVVLLCSIPLMAALANNLMSGDGGMLKIILCNEGKSETAAEIIDFLLNDDSVILYEKNDNLQEAVKKVEMQKADAVWCFADEFDKKITAFASRKSAAPFLRVIEREDTVPLQLSREKLYGAVYSEFSYLVYKSFLSQETVYDTDITETEIRSYYDKWENLGNVVEIEHLSDSVKVAEPNYLTAPLRGILSLLIMLCGFAAAMYFLKDKAEGKYDWLVTGKRIIPAFAQCLAAIIPSALAVLLAMYITGISVSTARELVSMALFIISATGFCLVLCTVFSSYGKLGAFVPGFIIIMLVLSPVFFNMNVLRGIRLMLPTYYYLHSIHNSDYYLYSAIYCICVYSLCIILNSILKKATAKN